MKRQKQTADNVVSIPYSRLHTSGGQYKKGSYRGLEILQFATPLAVVKDKKGKVIGRHTAPIRNKISV